MNYLRYLPAFILMWYVLSGCDKNDPAPEPYKPTPFTIEVPGYFPTRLNIPAENPMTVEGIALGRYLFYDGRLSGRSDYDSLMSCGSCHRQSRSFEAGTDHAVFTGGHTFGITGQRTLHATLPLVNLVWNHNGYFWNGLIHSSNENASQRRLEDIVWMTVLAPDEVAGDTNLTKQRIQQIEGYPELFYKAFGSETVTMENVSRAIAQFVRTLISANSKFDRYMRGDEQLSQQELNGFILFTTEEGADCFHCHGSSGNPLFTTNLFYNNGKDIDFDGLHDRYSITGKPIDKGAYKATTLRNVAFMGPYMHDGRFQTLDEVIDQYSHHVKMSDYVDPLMHHVAEGGVQLTPLEKAALKAFILSLQDDEFLTRPDFGPPETFPDGSTYPQVAGKFAVIDR